MTRFAIIPPTPERRINSCKICPNLQFGWCCHPAHGDASRKLELAENSSFISHVIPEWCPISVTQSVKLYYEELTPEQALQWLLKNDTGADEGFWAAAQASGADLRDDVFYNIRDFGEDEAVSIFKVCPDGTLESLGKNLGLPPEGMDEEDLVVHFFAAL